MLETYSEMWRDFIPPDQMPIFRQGGYYAVDIAPGLRVLALNTLYFFDSNDEVNGCRDKKGPGYEHFEWINNQLNAARRDRARVYMIGHVPPTDRTFFSSCLDRYTNLAVEYQDVIAGHFYGHVNMDHFIVLQKNQDYPEQDIDGVVNDEEEEDQHRIVMEDELVDITKKGGKYASKLRKQYRKIRENDPAVIIHVAPPILPEYNPTFRISEYNTDPTSSKFGTWTKYTQYYADLNYYNDKKQPELEPPEFYIEYSTDTDYGMTDLTTNSWINLAQRMSQKGSKESKKLWKKFVDNMFVQTNN